MNSNNLIHVDKGGRDYTDEELERLAGTILEPFTTAGKLRLIGWMIAKVDEATDFIEYEVLRTASDAIHGLHQRIIDTE